MNNKSHSKDFSNILEKSETLSDFYIQKAKTELNETEARKQQSIKQFKEWISKHPFITKCDIGKIYRFDQWFSNCVPRYSKKS
jgi:hypothetical protein